MITISTEMHSLWQCYCVQQVLVKRNDYCGFSGAAVFSDNSFGLSGALSTIEYLSCSSTANESSMSQCSFSGSCYLQTCTTEYGIRCYGLF